MNSVNEQMIEYMRIHPNAILAERHPHPTQQMAEYVIRAFAITPLHASTALSVGECIHNLRSVLDHISWQVARPKSRVKNRRRISFPVFDRKKPAKGVGFDHWLADNPRWSGIRRADLFKPRAVDLFRQVQPYRRVNGGHASKLWLLDDLWNADKHRQLVITHNNVGDVTVDIAQSSEPVSIERINTYRGAVHNDTELARFRLRPMPAHLQVKFNARLEIVFSNGLPNAKFLSISDLREVYKHIRDEIVPLFKPLLT